MASSSGHGAHGDDTTGATAATAARDSEALLRAQNRALEMILARAPLGATLDALILDIEALAPDMLGSILLLDRDGLHVRHGAAPSLPDSYVREIDGEPIGPRSGSCGTAAYRRAPVITEDILTDPLWEPYRDLASAHGLRACWSTPIFDGAGRVLGTFAMYFRQPGRPTPRHLHLIEAVTHTAAGAIVADQERDEAARSEALLAEAQGLAQLGSYEYDPRRSTSRRSDELCRIYGLTEEEFPRSETEYYDLIHPDDRARARALVDRSLREGTPFDFEARIVRPDGSVRLVRQQGRWTGPPGRDGTTLFGTCQDITEQRRIEEQARRTEELRIRNEELRAFSYMVSHDLKAPLRGVTGYASELRDDHAAELEPRARHCVEQIVQSTRNLNRLIDDLLRYARVDSEAVTLANVDIANVVESALAPFRTAAPDTRFVVELECREVVTWERGLHQILSNLIDNGVKYSRHATPPRVRITSARHGPMVRVSVHDNGIGFDMQDRERMFGLFARLAGPEGYEGTGAGLAIVRRIADRIGGRVWAESGAGGGATFHLELPRLHAD